MSDALPLTPTGPHRVLVVDDSEIVCESIALLLEEAGYLVQ